MTNTLIITRWSVALGSASVDGHASNCCLIDASMAGTKARGFRSKSSHKISAN